MKERERMKKEEKQQKGCSFLLFISFTFTVLAEWWFILDVVVVKVEDMVVVVVVVVVVIVLHLGRCSFL